MQPPPRMSPLRRLLARVLGRRRGEVRALQDLLAVEGVMQFTLVFGVMVLGPAALLSYFALSSIRAEELYVDADLDRRADAVAEQVHAQAQGDFERFEASTLARLSADQSPLTGLADLSPYLRAAFRFDAGGNLVAPFALPLEDPPGVPTTAYRTAFTAGARLELEGEPAAAIPRYLEARRATTDPSLAGQAELARARALRKAGQLADAERVFVELYSEYASVRDPYGFLLGDLATLQRVEIALERDPETATVAAVGMVDDLLEGPWTIGRPGEAAVTRRALTLLEGRADADWLARSRTRLSDLSSQLYWAEHVAGELELVGEARASAQPGQDGDFVYLGGETRALWATVWWKGNLYAFAFDPNALIAAVTETAKRAEALDPEVEAAVVGPQSSSPAGLRPRSLGPWLPTWAVAVGPADPQMLSDKKASKRFQRLVVIASAVGMSGVGVLLAARLLNREIEGARMKADFAANVSHELRAPITAIRLKGEALQLGLVYDDTDRQSHYDSIVHEAERLSRLVDNVLDFSAIERGAKKYIFRPEDIGEIIYNTVESTRNSVESRGIDVQIDVPDDLPVAWVDREAISQVFTNLLSNAAKYGAEGGWVGIRAAVAGDRIEMTITDKGVGIAPEELPQIFDRFYRSPDPKVRRYRGTGIGLTIVRYIVESHGGEIGVDSAPGRGTTFTIRLPLERREAGA